MSESENIQIENEAFFRDYPFVLEIIDREEISIAQLYTDIAGVIAKSPKKYSDFEPQQIILLNKEGRPLVMVGYEIINPRAQKHWYNPISWFAKSHRKIPYETVSDAIERLGHEGSEIHYVLCLRAFGITQLFHSPDGSSILDYTNYLVQQSRKRRKQLG